MKACKLPPLRAKTGKLPHHPGKLIRLALADLAKARNNKRVKVDMAEWFLRPVLPTDPCYVCLAGAAFLYHVRSKSFQTIQFSRGPRIIEAQLTALNSFRTGDVDEGLNYLEGVGIRPSAKTYDDVWTTILNREITPYDDNYRLFKRDLLKLAAEFDRKW